MIVRSAGGSALCSRPNFLCTCSSTFFAILVVVHVRGSWPALADRLHLQLAPTRSLYYLVPTSSRWLPICRSARYTTAGFTSTIIITAERRRSCLRPIARGPCRHPPIVLLLPASWPCITLPPRDAWLGPARLLPNPLRPSKRRAPSRFFPLHHLTLFFPPKVPRSRTAVAKPCSTTNPLCLLCVISTDANHTFVASHGPLRSPSCPKTAVYYTAASS